MYVAKTKPKYKKKTQLSDQNVPNYYSEPIRACSYILQATETVGKVTNPVYD